MKLILSFLMFTFLLIAPVVAQNYQWYSHPNPNPNQGQYTVVVQYQIHTNPQTGQIFVRLGNPSTVYMHCALYSNSGAYYVINLAPPAHTVSQWYPLGHYSVPWDYACN